MKTGNTILGGPRLFYSCGPLLLLLILYSAYSEPVFAQASQPATVKGLLREAGALNPKLEAEGQWYWLDLSGLSFDERSRLKEGSTVTVQGVEVQSYTPLGLVKILKASYLKIEDAGLLPDPYAHEDLPLLTEPHKEKPFYPYLERKRPAAYRYRPALL